jgi:hypothetical protein
MTTVVDPGTDWVPIRWGPWIRIRIRNLDPGGQKCPTKIGNI